MAHEHAPLSPAVLPRSTPYERDMEHLWPVVIDVDTAQPTWHKGNKRGDGDALQWTYSPLRGRRDDWTCCTSTTTTCTIDYTGRVPPVESAEAKRARRSAIEKMSRRKRQEALTGMRQEVRFLEKRVAELTVRSAGTQREGRWESDERPLAVVPMYKLQQKYIQLVQVRLELERDRRELGKSLLQQRKGRRQEHTASASTAYCEGTGRRLWESGRPLCPPSLAVRVRELALDECFRVVCCASRDIETFCAANSLKSTGATFMGWTDKRKVDRESQTMQYCFTKRFPLETPERLLAGGWQVFSNGDKMRAMAFDSSVHTRFEVLQVLNDKLIVIRRDHKFPTMALTFTSVLLVAWWETATGYTLCSRTIPTPEIEKALGPDENYYDAFHWVRFDRLFDELDKPAGCDVMFGGSVRDPNQLYSRHWLFELVCCVLRWEHACVAPLLLKRI
ncbi:unnamed protein product [Hyaloperonospora brassicae]|uniref:BZIP domain-containing protein n=1 Tax=Hyaloperonospora brassicae TaxID=162125 RepID=A0AAV0THT0_HYABA|nr:unnamed protein product [Hyaloperonospora brassicae]